MQSACLELRGLRRSFGKLLALDGISFSIAPGRLGRPRLAVIALLAGVAIRLEHSVAIVLMALGLLLVVALEARKHRWRGRLR